MSRVSSTAWIVAAAGENDNAAPTQRLVHQPPIGGCMCKKQLDLFFLSRVFLQKQI
jgi:hypothetical protein